MLGTYLRWKFDYDSFNLLSIRFPFYIAITGKDY
jgi:hypothetical protein